MKHLLRSVIIAFVSITLFGAVLYASHLGSVRAQQALEQLITTTGRINLASSVVVGPLAVANGGTGLASYAVGDLIYASGATTLASLADVATGNALISGGVGVAPSYGKIGLTTHISGTLAVGNGGTGATSITGLVLGNGASAMSAYGGVSSTNFAILALNAGGAATKDTLLQLGPTEVSLLANLAIDSTAVRDMTVDRHASGAGASYTLEAGGAFLGGTDLAGGNLVLKSGITTGSGSSQILMQVAAAGGSGTADRNPATLLTIGPTNVTLVSGQVLLPNGTSSAPSFSFTSQTGFGWYWVAGDTMAIGTGGVNQFSFRGGDLAMVAVAFLEWSSTANSQGEVDLLLGREAAAILQQGVDSATPIAQTYKGPDGSGTNIAGGIMRQASGRSTGNAVPALASIQGTAVSVMSGTTQQTLIDRFIPNAFKVLTNNSAIAVVNATVATGTVTGGLISYTIEVTDGTDVQVESGQAVYSTSNKAGTVAGTITEINAQQNLSVGTLATTWAISNANPAVISINANSSLTPSTGYPRITFSIQNFGQQAVAIQ